MGVPGRMQAIHAWVERCLCVQDLGPIPATVSSDTGTPALGPHLWSPKELLCSAPWVLPESPGWGPWKRWVWS